MANRILLGKSTNSNLGHPSGGKQGLFISAIGRDVTSCTKEQLSFNTDHIGNSSGAIDIGHFQVIPMINASNNLVTVVDFSTAAGASSAHSLKNLGAGGIVYGTNTNTFSGNNSGTSAGNSNASATSATVTNAALADPDTGNAVTNGATSGKVGVFKGFSTAALF
jgi:hypothetical protein